MKPVLPSIPSLGGCPICSIRQIRRSMEIGFLRSNRLIVVMPLFPPSANPTTCSPHLPSSVSHCGLTSVVRRLAPLRAPSILAASRASELKCHALLANLFGRWKLVHASWGPEAHFRYVAERDCGSQSDRSPNLETFPPLGANLCERLSEWAEVKFRTNGFHVEAFGRYNAGKLKCSFSAALGRLRTLVVRSCRDERAAFVVRSSCSEAIRGVAKFVCRPDDGMRTIVRMTESAEMSGRKNAWISGKAEGHQIIVGNAEICHFFPKLQSRFCGEFPCMLALRLVRA
uniref:THAP4-like heme-binding beta-barrel domain-containing protein n=1 Tax=Trichuris muris TaxID=70415 RepID=A0A5S6R4H2_TRIMR